MRSLILRDSSMSIVEILAGVYDVIICSYEFFHSNGKAMHVHRDAIIERANDQDGNKILPKRTTAALHSDLWKILDLPFKIAVFDEAQKVNKRGKQIHESLKNHLHAQSIAILSGTLAHNKWHNLSGYIDFGKSHPFVTHNKFLHTFASFDVSQQIERPTQDKVALLQRCLQAFTIARPASILNLPRCIKHYVHFDLLADEAERVSDLTTKYTMIAGILSGEMAMGIGGADFGDARAFAIAITAQMAALHPMLADNAFIKGHLPELEAALDEDPDGEIPEDKLEGLTRDVWLAAVAARPNIVEESGRLTTIMRLYCWLRMAYPEEKMVFFSTSLRFLDIISSAFSRTLGIEPLRYDGTVTVRRRAIVERLFNEHDDPRPLLITITAGESPNDLAGRSRCANY
jgi:SNF2 family DNA or RNA helicase